MKKRPLHRIALLLLLLISFVLVDLPAQIPFVYDVENTGAAYQAPPLPTLGNLPFIEPLPDPFAWAAEPHGSTRSIAFSDWARHRAEIKAQIENYEIGTKPAVDTSQVRASYSNGTLTVVVTVDGRTLTLTSAVSLPSGTGPFPAVIGMNSPNGSLPENAFTSRNIARITFSHDQVTTYNNPQNTNPFFVLYPNQNIDNTGQYAAWAWGVSRIIDGLEKTQGTLPIDLKHIAVTGCSYAGKMALFAGAFDERIALTISQESGGGGVANWRYSRTQAGVEGLAQTSNQWFKNSMFDFGNANVSYLPEDHHMLCTMVAPRALYVTGNTDYGWLSNVSCYVSGRAVQKVYDTFGISDRFGFCINGGHGHCALPASQDAELGYFLDKFLKGDTSLSQIIETHPVTYNTIDYERWYKWWGTGNPSFPPEVYAKKIWLESECATVGANWNILPDATASNGMYVMVKPGLNSTSSAPVGADNILAFSFTIDTAGIFNILARVNCPTANDDSYYIKIDNGSFTMLNGLSTTGWGWVMFANTTLEVGEHTLTVAYREDGAKLDKILVTTSGISPTDIGTAGNPCNINAYVVPPVKSKNVYISPNPVSETLKIKLSDSPSLIGLFNSNGRQLVNLDTNNSDINLDMAKYSPGIYFLSVLIKDQTFMEKIIKE